MEISMDWTPYWQSLDPSQGLRSSLCFPHRSSTNQLRRPLQWKTTELRGGFVEGKQLENYKFSTKLTQKWHTHLIIQTFNHMNFQKLANSFMFWGKFQDFLPKPKPCWTEKHNSGIISHHFPPGKPGATKFDQIVCWRIFQSNLHTLQTKTVWYSVYIYTYTYTYIPRT